MTTAEQFRTAITHPRDRAVLIAGVPWPAYKVVALILGLVVFGIVSVATPSAGPALLTAAAATTVVWIALGVRLHGR